VDAATGQPQQQATVDGAHDSLPYLVDRLAVQLLALGAGVRSQQLASLTSASLPALRAYLGGRSAGRAGRWGEAVRRYDAALGIDSGFALAGIGLSAASAWLDGAEERRGRELAWAARDRLSWRDRTVLEAASTSGPRALEQVVRKIPDSPEAWLLLGDRYFHDGALYGVADPDARALAAFRRALALDTTSSTNPNAEPLMHFTDLALAAGDSATVRRLLSLALAHDSTGEFAASQRLELARATGDTATLARAWAGLERAEFPSLLTVIWGTQESGEDVREADRALSIARRRAGPDAARLMGLLAHDLALNRGRPLEAIALDPPVPAHPRGEVRALIDDALYWDGDSAAAARGARATAEVVARPPPADTASTLHAYYYDVCTLAQWRLAHGELHDAPTAAAQLRRAAGIPHIQFPEEHERCADLLDAWHATAAHLPDAAGRVARVDSLQVREPVGVTASSIEASNILVARLWSALGDWPRAEAAARRRYRGLNPRFLSTYLLEEGRAAARAGHPEAARRALRHYLALRYQPEAALRPRVEQVRVELKRLGPGR
jgi:tetratricopeptide (TPR) repeat protein